MKGRRDFGLKMNINKNIIFNLKSKRRQHEKEFNNAQVFSLANNCMDIQ